MRLFHILLLLTTTQLQSVDAGTRRDEGEVPTLSPTSSVPGKAFDRFVTIWLENTDYDKAAGDQNLKWLAERGITLENYFAVTHPSMPNYIAAIGGDYYGTNHGEFVELPLNISSIVDVLESADISWGTYQEDMPHTGFQGYEFDNPTTKANMYVRRHNPCVIYNSIATSTERLGLIKNTTWFERDLAEENLPQWIFITPNMTSDGHDTSVTVAGEWTRNFLEPLLDNQYFMNNTLILVTFDENHSYTKQNRVFSILLGGAVPESKHGTVDTNYYDHYSEIATVTANWDLPTLGRYDVGANVFSLVADKTDDEVRQHPDISSVYLNESYPGIFNKKYFAPQPIPNITLVTNGRPVLKSIRDAWSGSNGPTTYRGQLVIPSRDDPPEYGDVEQNSASGALVSTYSNLALSIAFGAAWFVIGI